MGRGRMFERNLLRSFLAVSIALYPMLSLAQDAVSRKAAPDVPAKTSVPSKGGTPQSTYSVVVYQRVDGNLAGRVNILDAAGRRLPAKAHVSVIQRGKTIASVDANERGLFQLSKLLPGVYSVIASGPDGFAVIAAHVLPYTADAPQEQLLLDLTLVPPDDADALAKLLAQTDPPDPPDAQPCVDPPMAGGASGGGGGGGGGGLGMLGLAMGAVGMGLGIGAIANQPASPTTP